MDTARALVVGPFPAESDVAILLDGSNRRTIARLRFNGKSRTYPGLFDADKNSTRTRTRPATSSNLDGIHQHAEAIRASVRYHLA
ncbi:hypothetical protein [Marinitenerispora sediminis]|uniref:Uncharacterized protein n=1 Tax=Marinitenerispora sediminis TaxID=1931232 RepID=A0A368T9L6_9ACTN|nr:hypothetical protein [Marinitenerispora sediminis]RCV58118.1 hypothetical protein DEF28_00100 [Marinitenerispora sediminis]RCV58740.1 hypothetical protein DEF23_08255 [Marinitenerispora sediminis]RCV61391.1 hypothetical protein DEF24_04370 [Marinitenerispora sediminis]